jgi:LysM repeat protein
MNYKQIIQAAMAAMLIVITLSACVRPASTPPEESAGASTTAEFPVPGTADDVMSQLESLATQTAIAMQGGTPQVQPTAMVATQVAPTAAVTDVTQPTAIPASPEPTQQQVVVPTATPGLPASWTLQTGEFPYCIARRYNVNPNEMLELSGLSAGGTYTAGTVLKIPKTGNTFPGPRSLRKHPDTYSVKSGDTIYSIACIYGDADPNAMIFANSLQSPYNLKAGQEISIP